MRKQSILFLCCLALVFFCSAQQHSLLKFYPILENEIFLKQTDKEKNEEQLIKDINFENEFIRQKLNLQGKGINWYEPDTITTYSVEGGPLDRYIFSYENENCATYSYQFFRLGKWDNIRKYNYKYDAQKKIIEVLYQEGNAEQWENSSIDIYTYNSHHNIAEILSKGWNSGQWTDSYRHIYTYDSHKNKTGESRQRWNSGQWVIVEEWIYTYNSQNNMIEKLYKNFESSYRNYKYSYKYDLHNNITEEVYEDHEYGSLRPVYKFNYIYNTLHEKIEEYRCYWYSNQWEISEKLAYTYNTLGNMTEGIRQNWKSEKWVNDSRFSYTFDEQNNNTEYLYQEWKSEQWVNRFRYTYYFDTKNNKTEEICQTWESEQWKNYIRWGNSYDENNNSTAGFYQMWDGTKWVGYNGNGIWVYYNNMKSKHYVMRYRFTASYVKTNSVGINENITPNNLVKLFPNPVSNVLYIETNNPIITEVKIYSIQGVLLLRVKGNQIDVSSLPSGTYIAEVEGVSRKIVKL